MGKKKEFDQKLLNVYVRANARKHAAIVVVNCQTFRFVFDSSFNLRHRSFLSRCVRPSHSNFLRTVHKSYPEEKEKDPGKRQHF